MGNSISQAPSESIKHEDSEPNLVIEKSEITYVFSNPSNLRTPPVIRFHPCASPNWTRSDKMTNSNQFPPYEFFQFKIFLDSNMYHREIWNYIIVNYLEKLEKKSFPCCCKYIFNLYACEDIEKE
jgi:hypothetical protein